MNESAGARSKDPAAGQAGALSEDELARLSQWLSAEMGLHFSRERRVDLERAFQAASAELGFSSPRDCIEALLRRRPGRTQIEVLAAHLTVGETYFMRDAGVYEVLKTQIWPEIVRQRAASDRQLRIWSAGCSSGEEPYSIAMFLRERMPELHGWNVDILATDINARALQKASRGVYRQWSFRGTPEWVREKYFTAAGNDTWRIRPEIQRMVRFSYLNLAEDVYPTLVSGTIAMDVIFCRNVLMYFLPAAADQVVAAFYRALVEGGSLVVSACEASVTQAHPFIPMTFPGALLFRKSAPLPGTFPAPPSPQASVEKAREEADALPVSGPNESIERAAPPRAESDPAHSRAASEKTESGPAPPAGMAILLEKARECGNQGRLKEALEWCEQAIGTDKLNSAAHFLMAAILLEQARREEARAALRRVLYLEPEFIMAHFVLGNLARQSAQIRQAEVSFQTALRLLNNLDPASVLPESEGITAGRLKELILSMREPASAHES
jgi:chemotaxis protein methyltransferase CheR